MTVTFAKLGQYGRLGNQLWEIAVCIGYAHRYNCDFKLPNWEYKKYFNIPEDKFSEKVIFLNTFEEPHFHYAGIPFQPNLNLHGYFQSPLYWQDCANLVREYLTPREILDNSEFCAIHVRRGDYLSHTGCYHILDRENYYNKAMEKVGIDKYLIFSDDLAWCRANFQGDQFHFSEERDPVKDLANMIGCSQHIIANSSFSWWGAWLANSEQVIAPKQWFGPKLATTHNTKDLIPKGWVGVENG